MRYKLYQYPSQYNLIIIRSLLTLSAVTGFLYILWRLDSRFWINPWLSIPLLIAEIIFFIGFLINLPVLWLKKSSKKTYKTIQQNITIDIVIPSYDEDFDVITKTINNSLNVKIPSKVSLNIYILDDGKRAWLKSYILNEKATYKNIYYIARENRRGFKAGNLNNYLKQYCMGDFILTLDADHAPHKDILHQLAPYTNNKKIGYVQAPQVFSNINEKDTLNQNPDFWFGVLELGRYGFDALICCGTPTLWSRRALNSIGGFVESVTEDFATGVRLQAKGWEAFYHPYEVAKGLASEDLQDVVNKTARYTTGALELTHWRRSLPQPNNLNLLQKVLHYTYPVLFIIPLLSTVFLTLPILSIFSNSMPFSYSGNYSISFAHLLYLLSMQLAYYMLTGKTFFRSWQFYISLFPANAVGVARFIKGNKKFVVSNKKGSNNSLSLVKYQLILFVSGTIAILYGTVVLPSYSLSERIPGLFWIVINNILLFGVLEVPLIAWGRRYVTHVSKHLSYMYDRL